MNFNGNWKLHHWQFVINSYLRDGESICASETDASQMSGSICDFSNTTGGGALFLFNFSSQRDHSSRSIALINLVTRANNGGRENTRAITKSCKYTDKFERGE